MLTKEYLVVVRDEQGELIQIFRNDKAATLADIEKCLKDTNGETAFLDVVYRLKKK